MKFIKRIGLVFSIFECVEFSAERVAVTWFTATGGHWQWNPGTRCNPGFSANIPDKTGVWMAGSCSLLPDMPWAGARAVRAASKGLFPPWQLMGATVTLHTELPPAPLGLWQLPPCPTPPSSESLTSCTSLGAQLGKILLHHSCFFALGWFWNENCVERLEKRLCRFHFWSSWPILGDFFWNGWIFWGQRCIRVFIIEHRNF